MLIRKFLITGFIITSIFILSTIFSINFVDKFLTLKIHQLKLDKLNFLSFIVNDLPIIYTTIFFLSLFFIFPKNNFGSKYLFITYILILFFLTLWFKNKLKIAFGREWPSSWSKSHYSLLKDNVFTFNWLRYKDWKGSFPSGHTTLTSLTSFLAIIIYPRFKFFWNFILLIVILCLIILNYHFLSDCLAAIALAAFTIYFGLAFYFMLKPLIKSN